MGPGGPGPRPGGPLGPGPGGLLGPSWGPGPGGPGFLPPPGGFFGGFANGLSSMICSCLSCLCCCWLLQDCFGGPLAPAPAPAPPPPPPPPPF